MVCQHDPRQVDVLKDLILEHGTSVQTPAVRDVTDDEPEPLDQAQSSNDRSQVERCLFLGQDRTDMSNPTHQSFAKLKKTGQILEAREAVGK